MQKPNIYYCNIVRHNAKDLIYNNNKNNNTNT